MDEWKYLQKLRKSERHSVWVLVAVVTGVLALAAAIFCLIKFCKAKGLCPFSRCNGGCDCDNDDCDCGDHCDCDNDDCDCGDHCDCDNDNADGKKDNSTAEKVSSDCDENGCCYTNDKDFV